MIPSSLFDSCAYERRQALGRAPLKAGLYCRYILCDTIDIGLNTLMIMDEEKLEQAVGFAVPSSSHLVSK